MPPTTIGYVYLIEAKVDNTRSIYKIGRSIKPIKRMADLQTISPIPLSLLCELDSQNMQKLEQELHKKYVSKRLHGEWFLLSSEDVEEIKQHPLSNKFSLEKQEDIEFVEDLKQALLRL